MARTCKGIPHRARQAGAATTVKKSVSSIKKSVSLVKKSALSANEAALYVKEVLNVAEKAIDAVEKVMNTTKKAMDSQHTTDKANTHWELKTFVDKDPSPLPLYKNYVQWQRRRIFVNKRF